MQEYFYAGNSVIWSEEIHNSLDHQRKSLVIPTPTAIPFSVFCHHLFKCLTRSLHFLLLKACGSSIPVS